MCRGSPEVLSRYLDEERKEWHVDPDTTTVRESSDPYTERETPYPGFWDRAVNCERNHTYGPRRGTVVVGRTLPNRGKVGVSLMDRVVCVVVSLGARSVARKSYKRKRSPNEKERKGE